MRRRRRPKGQHRIKLTYEWHERQHPTAKFTTILPNGHIRRKHKVIPYDKPTPLPDETIRPRRIFTEVEATTMGTGASLAGLDLNEGRRYQWRGMSNKQALRIALQIKDQIPDDSYFSYAGSGVPESEMMEIEPIGLFEVGDTFRFKGETYTIAELSEDRSYPTKLRLKG